MLDDIPKQATARRGNLDFIAFHYRYLDGRVGKST
jgi:hypothetical protein